MADMTEMTTQSTGSGSQEPVSQIRAALAERIEQGTLDLPLLPQVASQVMALTGDPNTDAARFSSLIHQDQALAGHILRIANCPAYMPRSPIVSLQQSIAWLGLNILAEIAVTISLQNGVFRVQGYKAEIKQLWRHAFATALYGKEIARLGRHNVESAFLCGLLHSIGKPVILHAVSELQKQVETTLPWDAMHMLMQEYHTQVGTVMADRWNLPSQVRAAITYYDNYMQAPSHPQAAMTTCLANRFATHLIDPQTLTEQAVREQPVVRDLNLYPDDLTALFEKRDTILTSADAMAL
ncbi:MAG: HDOD domain-containing protein [Nitrospirales bacterium]